MSLTSRWSYKNTMIVWPHNGYDPRTGDVSYGEPYKIACTFITGGVMQRDDRGEEFVPSWTVWHEDGDKIKPNDMIKVGAIEEGGDPIAEGAKQVRKITMYDMSPFGEAYDYVAYTG